jgi:hypothetical protein
VEFDATPGREASKPGLDQGYTDGGDG